MNDLSNIVTQFSIFGVLISFLVVGFMFKKKPKNMKEYALGDGKFSTSSLVATMIATAVGGGSIVGISSELYEGGVWVFFVYVYYPYRILHFGFFHNS